MPELRASPLLALSRVRLFDMSVQVSFEAPIWVFAYALK